MIIRRTSIGLPRTHSYIYSQIQPNIFNGYAGFDSIDIQRWEFQSKYVNSHQTMARVIETQILQIINVDLLMLGRGEWLEKEQVLTVYNCSVVLKAICVSLFGEIYIRWKNTDVYNRKNYKDMEDCFIFDITQPPFEHSSVTYCSNHFEIFCWISLTICGSGGISCSMKPAGFNSQFCSL